MSSSISVVIPTLGRTGEVDALLRSLASSAVAPHEVILVDQNASDLLDEIVARHSAELPIRHLKVCLRGLSRARNEGVRHATGEIVCFPDDDCELFPDTLQRAVETLEKSHGEVVFGRSATRDGNDAVTPFVRQAGRLTHRKHQGMFVDFSIFARKSILERFPYDEDLGVGAFHGAEEGYDLVLRLLEADVPMFYSPDIVFYHPIKVTSHRSAGEVRRVFTYRCGFSRLCLKHKLHGKLWNRLLKVSLYLVYVSAFRRSKTRYYLAEWLGIVTGIVVK